MGSLDTYDNDFELRGVALQAPLVLETMEHLVKPMIYEVPLAMEDIQEGDLIVSEVMHSPAAVSDYLGEWFEIYNTTSNGYILTGLQITSDAGEQFTITEEIVIPAQGYIVFAARQSPENGGN